MLTNRIRVALSLLFLTQLIATDLAQSNRTADALTSALCVIIGDVRSVVGGLAVGLLVVGVILFTAGYLIKPQVDPNTQKQKRSGLSILLLAVGVIFLLNGVIGVVLVVLAPSIVYYILGFNTGTGVAPNNTGTGVAPSCA